MTHKNKFHLVRERETDERKTKYPNAFDEQITYDPGLLRENVTPFREYEVPYAL